ncbi:MAG: hypothetical protein K2G41_11450, partial [Duncaniella sp.]|nr:hypothetical protein [Duncaniella sp.]
VLLARGRGQVYKRQAYIGLYILSPILNVFCEKSNQVQFTIVILAFFIFQTIYGMSGAAVYIEGGYSTFSFIGLYLLSQFIKRYVTDIYRWGGVMCIISVIANSILSYFLIIKTNVSIWFIFSYINPVVIIGSVGLLLFFSRLRIKTNRIINWIAASAFAVFLTHGNPNIGTPYFKPFIRQLYNNFNGIECIVMILIGLAAIFVFSILLDQPRKWLWNFISRYLPNYKL